MQTLSQLHDDSPFEEIEERSHGRRLLVGILCALLLTGALFGGYMFLRKRHERQLAAAAEATRTKALAPRVEVFVDDPTMDGKKTLLGGTLHNISGEVLRNLSVELELRQRKGGGLETRTITPEQTELAPDAKARYGVELQFSDYSSARLVRIVGGDNHAQVPFKALPGTPRPPMESPSAKTVIVNRPGSRGEEFINTPNTPGRVP
ncbi:MAG TPA: hypothetical protein VLQ90_07265 [Pyrinomonadaceae bacterium]|nr:hypothetical protein [Pyrinomonadaceae bacterium]